MCQNVPSAASAAQYVAMTATVTSVVGLSDGIKLLLTSRIPNHQPTLLPSYSGEEEEEEGEEEKEVVVGEGGEEEVVVGEEMVGGGGGGGGGGGRG